MAAHGVERALAEVAFSGPSIANIGLPRLSIIVPAYNEAGNIAAALQDIMQCVVAEVPDAEVIVVDDGSRDGTAEIVQVCAAMDGRIRLIRQPNGGHGPALVRGIVEARGEYCLLLDSDRQIGLEQFAQTWPLRTGHGAVIGVRQRRQDPLHRLWLSQTLRATLRMACGVRATDPNVPYKLVHRSLLLDAIAAMPPKPRIPSVLLMLYLSHRKARITEQAVPHRRRIAGEPSLRVGRLVRFCSHAALELARFQMRH